MNVGTKELKNRLSHYLRLVRDGEIVRVTDRGNVVAELRAVEPQQRSTREILQEMEDEGLVTIGRGRLAPFKGFKLRGRGRLASDYVTEDRG